VGSERREGVEEGGTVGRLDEREKVGEEENLGVGERDHTRGTGKKGGAIKMKSVEKIGTKFVNKVHLERA